MAESSVAVIAVHGIADQTAGETLAAVRKSLSAVGWTTTHVYTRPVPRAGEADLDVPAARMTRGAEAIEILECYWADLSRAADRPFPLLLQVIQVLVGLPSALVDRLPPGTVGAGLLRAARFVQITWALPAFFLALGAVLGYAASRRLGPEAWALAAIPPIAWGWVWADVEPRTKWRVRRVLAIGVSLQLVGAALAPALVPFVTWRFALVAWAAQILGYGAAWLLWLARRVGRGADLEVNRFGAAVLASWVGGNLLAVGLTLAEASALQAVRWSTGVSDHLAGRLVVVAAAMALPIVLFVGAWLVWESLPAVRARATPEATGGDLATTLLRVTAVLGPPVWGAVVGVGIGIQLAFGGLGWVSWLGAAVTLVAPFVLYNLTSGRTAIDLVLDVYSWLAPGAPPPRLVMTDRFEALLAHCTDRPGVVVVAHSQGSLIAADVLARRPSPRRGLVTAGSPLRQMYAWFVPGEYGWAGLTEPGLGAVHAARLHCDRWINLFTLGDYVGRHLWWQGRYADLPTVDGRQEATDGPATDRLVLVGGRHQRYFGSPELGFAVDEVISAVTRARAA